MLFDKANKIVIYEYFVSTERLLFAFNVLSKEIVSHINSPSKVSVTNLTFDGLYCYAHFYYCLVHSSKSKNWMSFSAASLEG